MYVPAGAEETTKVVRVEKPATPLDVVGTTETERTEVGANEIEVDVLSRVTGEKVEDVPVGACQCCEL